MNLFWARLGSVGALLTCVTGCGGEAPTEATDLSQLSVVEVTTVTTVQSSKGIFLSPRPRQVRPGYVATGSAARAPAGTPSQEEARAKVDSALLFDSSAEGRFRVEAVVPSVDAQHFYPPVNGERWLLEPAGPRSDEGADAWGEFDGWKAYPGLMVGAAAAATLDYERVGLRAPLVVSIGGDDAATLPLEAQTLTVTNRSDESVTRALLIYSHEGGVGVREVGSIIPGESEVTTTGPKERPPTALLDEARARLEAFLSAEFGPDLGATVARAKSVPFLEAHGLRMIYVLSDSDAPAAVGLPGTLTARRQVAIGQAEVLTPSEEAHVQELLATGTATGNEVATELGRFARAKLETVTLSNDRGVRTEAERLLEELEE